MPANTARDENAHDVVEELSLIDWCNFTPDEHGEFLHAHPDVENRRLHLYRLAGEVGSNERVKTTVENVSFRFHGEEEPDHFYLTDTEVRNLIILVNLMAKEVTAPERVTVTHYPDNGRPMMEGKDVTEESLYIEYRTETGRERKVTINTVYDRRDGMLANYSSRGN